MRIKNSVMKLKREHCRLNHACEDLSVGGAQLLVGELHQRHQVVRVLHNKSCYESKNKKRSSSSSNVTQTS